MNSEIGKELISPFSNFEIDSVESSSTDGESEEDNDIYYSNGDLKPYKDTRKGQVYLLGDWYMKPTKFCEMIFGELDILTKQASLLTFKKEYKKAFDTYKEILFKFKHNYNHKQEILDALIHCGTKAHLMKDLKIVYEAYKKTIETLGDQINFWTTNVTIGEYDKNEEVVNNVEHLKSVIYLCSLTECGRHWLLFDNISKNFIPEKCNFRIGSKIRAYFWLKSEFKILTTASDSVEKFTEKQMLRIQEELENNYSESGIIEAKNNMWTKFIRTGKDNEDKDEGTAEPPPHACKLGGKIKTKQDLFEMRQRFVTIYSWLFNGLEGLVDKILEDSIEKDDGKTIDEILNELKDDDSHKDI